MRIRELIELLEEVEHIEDDRWVVVNDRDVIGVDELSGGVTADGSGTRPDRISLVVASKVRTASG